MPEPQTFVATGKRKTAVARVRLRIGTGQIRVNGRTLEDYFPREASRMIIHQPLETVNGVGRYDIAATLHGGGISGQADALRHGITRALEMLDPGEPPRAQEARLPDPRRAQEGAQEVRPARRARAVPVLEALGPR